jgi:glycosyltransferase involved in cell wall biosynthesis
MRTSEAPRAGAERRLRVVHVAGSAEWGGGERYLELLARHLDRERFSLAVVMPAEGPLRARLASAAVEAHVVDLGALVSVRAVVRLAAVLRRLAPDVVQSHGARSNVYTRLAARLAGVPAVVSTIHNALADYPVSLARLALYRAVERFTRPLATCAVCVAAALAPEDPARSVVIHNGIDVDDFDPDAGRLWAPALGRDLGLGTGPVVGFVGRLTPQKDPVAFVRTLATLRASRPDVQGLVVGDGPLRSTVEDVARALGVTCRFVGERDDVTALFALVDVFLLTSVSEGFPFVVLEAMAMERPVVATAVNGVPEIVEDGVTGVLVARGDVDGMARALLGMLASPGAARAMGRAGRRRVAERFTARRMADETQALYLRLLSRAPTVAATRA